MRVPFSFYCERSQLVQNIFTVISVFLMQVVLISAHFFFVYIY